MDDDRTLSDARVAASTSPTHGSSSCNVSPPPLSPPRLLPSQEEEEEEEEACQTTPTVVAPHASRDVLCTLTTPLILADSGTAGGEVPTSPALPLRVLLSRAARAAVECLSACKEEARRTVSAAHTLPSAWAPLQWLRDTHAGGVGGGGGREALDLVQCDMPYLVSHAPPPPAAVAAAAAAALPALSRAALLLGNPLLHALSPRAWDDTAPDVERIHAACRDARGACVAIVCLAGSITLDVTLMDTTCAPWVWSHLLNPRFSQSQEREVVRAEWAAHPLLHHVDAPPAAAAVVDDVPSHPMSAVQPYGLRVAGDVHARLMGLVSGMLPPSRNARTRVEGCTAAPTTRAKNVATSCVAALRDALVPPVGEGTKQSQLNREGVRAVMRAYAVGISCHRVTLTTGQGLVLPAYQSAVEVVTPPSHPHHASSGGGGGRSRNVYGTRGSGAAHHKFKSSDSGGGGGGSSSAGGSCPDASLSVGLAACGAWLPRGVCGGGPTSTPPPTDCIAADTRAVEATHAAATADIHAVETTHAAATADVHAVETTHAAATADVHAVEATHAAATADVHAVETTHAAAATDVHAVETMHAAATADVHAVEATHAAATADVHAVETTHAAATADVHAVETTHAAAPATADVHAVEATHAAAAAVLASSVSVNTAACAGKGRGSPAAASAPLSSSPNPRDVPLPLHPRAAAPLHTLLVPFQRCVILCTCTPLSVSTRRTLVRQYGREERDSGLGGASTSSPPPLIRFVVPPPAGDATWVHVCNDVVHEVEALASSGRAGDTTVVMVREANDTPPLDVALTQLTEKVLRTGARIIMCVAPRKPQLFTAGGSGGGSAASSAEVSQHTGGGAASCGPPLVGASAAAVARSAPWVGGVGSPCRTLTLPRPPSCVDALVSPLASASLRTPFSSSSSSSTPHGTGGSAYPTSLSGTRVRVSPACVETPRTCGASPPPSLYMGSAVSPATVRSVGSVTPRPPLPSTASPHPKRPRTCVDERVPAHSVEPPPLDDADEDALFMSIEV